MNQPTLALCIPAYNAAKHLPRLLDSAASQTIPFDEIIVCDDASKDNTATIAASLGAKVLANSVNRGCSVSKNHALAAATADWVHFHDADDILLPGFTAEAAVWMAMNDAPEVVIMAYEYRNFETWHLYGVSSIDDAAIAADPIRYSIEVKLPNFGIYQRTALSNIGGFDCDPDVLYNEDVAFHTKLALHGFRFRASNKITSINFLHSQSMSQNNQAKCLKAQFAVMRKVATVAGQKYPREIATKFWAVATGLAAHEEWTTADAALAAAAKLCTGVPSGNSPSFDFLCRLIGPRLAFRARERVIRKFKPHLR